MPLTEKGFETICGEFLDDLGSGEKEDYRKAMTRLAQKLKIHVVWDQTNRDHLYDALLTAVEDRGLSTNEAEIHILADELDRAGIKAPKED